MRKIQSAQVQLGEIDVGAIEIELDNRDEIPQLLRGLQHIYTTRKVRKRIFDLLITLVTEQVDITVGRDGIAGRHSTIICGYLRRRYWMRSM